MAGVRHRPGCSALRVAPPIIRIAPPPAPLVPLQCTVVIPDMQPTSTGIMTGWVANDSDRKSLPQRFGDTMNIANPAITSIDPLAELLALIADARTKADDLGLAMVAIYLDQAFMRCEDDARKRNGEPPR